MRNEMKLFPPLEEEWRDFALTAGVNVDDSKTKAAFIAGVGKGYIIRDQIQNLSMVAADSEKSMFKYQMQLHMADLEIKY